jgi:hypothetical protein
MQGNGRETIGVNGTQALVRLPPQRAIVVHARVQQTM